MANIDEIGNRIINRQTERELELLGARTNDYIDLTDQQKRELLDWLRRNQYARQMQNMCRPLKPHKEEWGV